MESNRILWVDWLKFLAIFGVIGIHVSSSLLTSDILLSLEWYQGVIAGSFFRFGIILFVMASGFLILRKKQSIEDIPRRAKRILLPFVFWLIVYAIIKIIFKHELGSNLDLYNVLWFIVRGFLDPTIISVQFWYVYMILGLYILSPMVSGWIENAPIKEMEYFIWIWLVISFLQFLNINSILFDYFKYFTGAIGYFILGYYLTVTENDLLKNRKIGVLMFIVGLMITILGTISFSILTNDQSLLFIKLGDLTPGAFLQGIGLFIIVANTDFSGVNEKINNFVVKISKTSYGIYLANILVINFLVMFGLIYLKGATLIFILIYTCLVLVVSAIIIEIMDRIPILKWFSGKS